MLTNPDLLHHSVLPAHARWRGLLQSLRYVVIDEAHRYRGVFGAQVAGVLRRLRRLAAHYGARPTFVLASATGHRCVADRRGPCSASRPTTSTSSTGTPRRAGSIDISLWQPEGRRRTTTAELLADLVAAGRQTIAFVPSRRLCEVVARRARERAARTRGARPRGRPECRCRGVPRRLPGHATDDDSRRTCRAVGSAAIAATNALELGVDIAGVDAVVDLRLPGQPSRLVAAGGPSRPPGPATRR